MSKQKKIFISVAAIVLSAILYFSVQTIEGNRNKVQQRVELRKGDETIIYRASIELHGNSFKIYEKDVPVILIPDGDSYPTCRVSDADWAEIDSEQQELSAKVNQINVKAQNYFGGVKILELGQDLYVGDWEWEQESRTDHKTKDGWWCDDQVIVYRFQNAIVVPWNNIDAFPPDTEGIDGSDIEPVVMIETYGDFNFIVKNLVTKAELGFSIPGERIYNLAKGIMLDDAAKLKLADKPLHKIEKTNPVQSLNTKEIGSFVVTQEDFQTRDIFVKLIEAILPLTANGPSLSFIQSSSQGGNESYGSISGTQEGNLGGIMMGGWGFVSGSFEGSIDGEFNSRPVMYVRGSIYILPKP